MKRLVTKFLLCAGLLSSSFASLAANPWQAVDVEKAPKNLQVMHPSSFLVYTLDEATLKLQMWNLSTNPKEGITVKLPMPDGSFRDFIVWQTPMMPAELASRYPDIKTFTAKAVGNARVTAKLEFTLYGLTAMIFDGENTSFVDPFDNYHDGFYMVHYKRDEVRPLSARMKCEVRGENDANPSGSESIDMMQSGLPKLAHRTTAVSTVSNGLTFRAYRLALTADSFYCRAATGVVLPTIAQALSKMTTSMNRINGVYNREFSVQMNFCNNEDTLIFGCAGHTNGNDPFATIDNNGNACLSKNQTVATARITSANFDLGHVFTTGGGGVSNLGVVCRNNSKAESCTGSPSPTGDGYDIDYVAHEMGHEFGSEHTFNNNIDGSCSTNAVSSCAYEPGSGGTIMDYAGICSPDDLQPHSNSYFSASSLVQIQSSLVGSENTCAVTEGTGNKIVALAPFSASYSIPYKTPFELTAPVAFDSVVADSAISYGWLQWNLGDFGKRLNQTFLKGPIFRSYTPSDSTTRVFPKVSMVLSGVLSNAGTEDAEGEKAADTARYMTFKLVVRNQFDGTGCFLFPVDTIHIDAIQTATFAGFKVTSQNTTGISYAGGSTQTITWDVVGTDAAPINAANVDIYLSTDGGYTWTVALGTFPNTGSATVVLPNPAANALNTRIKVKGSGNVFFNVNSKAFALTHSSTAGVTQTNIAANDIKVFPVPATNILHMTTGAGSYHATVCNSVGQAVWQGDVNQKTDITVSSWAKGVYYVRFADVTTGDLTVKSVVIR